MGIGDWGLGTGEEEYLPRRVEEEVHGVTRSYTEVYKRKNKR